MAPLKGICKIYILAQGQLTQKYYVSQVQPNRASNLWPPDHDSTFHVSETLLPNNSPSRHFIFYTEKNEVWKMHILFVKLYAYFSASCYEIWILETGRTMIHYSLVSRWKLIASWRECITGPKFILCICLFITCVTYFCNHIVGVVLFVKIRGN